MRLVSYFICLLYSFMASADDMTKPVKIKVSNIQKWQGNLVVSFFNSEENYLKQPIIERIVKLDEKAEDGIASFTEKITEGDYAIAIYHDVNGNGELDTNFFGVPNEPTGFSNDAEASFGPPEYKDAVITISVEPVMLKLVH